MVTPPYSPPTPSSVASPPPPPTTTSPQSPPSSFQSQGPLGNTGDISLFMPPHLVSSHTTHPQHTSQAPLQPSLPPRQQLISSPLPLKQEPVPSPEKCGLSEGSPPQDLTSLCSQITLPQFNGKTCCLLHGLYCRVKLKR